MEETKRPSYEELKQYLGEYGWSFKETTADEGKQLLVTPFYLESERKGILITFRVEGEFALVSTMDFLVGVPARYADKVLKLNDTTKLVKLFMVNEINESGGAMDLEVGFELWGEAWNKETFFAFMDMLCMGIERVKQKFVTGGWEHETKFVTFSE